ncbi:MULTISPECIES: Na+/H+ antiporter NhaC [unclassified Fusibacter]|uniref:Na+/H+ antiporter NhaC n=1 Tax=unclassified Fusibacter TaxID=2624464 RepID=UPI00101101E2|nr:MULTISPECIES: Na+/H+ antiporter NhaC [unclassified Fusibacter]MCK8059077.1 Na+/H+ antiporter NhaC [Fusibacter sp. A2]NPE22486.1 Na+/H+ antiporter NhaC [Fusibacter sp. A1]RXV60590.1 Na+/H+ antiporter NhaC [Fusibacter sp. A1]
MKQKKTATLGIALIPVIFLVAFLAYAMMVNNVWESGWIDVHIPLLSSAMLAVVVAVFGLNYKWEEIEEGIVDIIKASMGAILILMIIGVVIGTWLQSGVVPAMIYWGLQVMNPAIFLVATLLITSFVSLATGSSWTTAATVGIALMGVGQGLGIPTEVIGGAIISGAYFGDKMSPLSDTTNLAPGIAGANLFDHIRHMIYTTGPSYVIALIFFGVLGIKYSQGVIDQAAVDGITTALSSSFNLNPLLLLAPILVIGMVILKIPAIPGLFSGGVIGAIFAFIFQKADFNSVIDSMHYGFGIETGNAIVDDLVSGGGLDGMMWTVSLILCAMMFGGVMEKTGMLRAIAQAMLKFAKSTGSLITTTIVTSLIMNVIAGDQYLAIVIPGRMYKEEYDKRGLHPKNLSRTLEDCATLTSPLVPWNSCGAYMIGTLGLTPWTYVPYTILNWVNPLIAILWGYTGFSIEYVDSKEETKAV